MKSVMTSVAVGASLSLLFSIWIELVRIERRLPEPAPKILKYVVASGDTVYWVECPAAQKAPSREAILNGKCAE